MAPTFETGPTLAGELKKALESSEAERKKENEKSKSDPLTGYLLFDKNKDGIQKLIDDMNFSNDVRRHKTGAVMVVFCDLNDFKPINDKYGHPVGDDALRVFADRLAKAETRTTESVYRKGGDEFILVLPIDNDQEITDSLLEKIMNDLRGRVNNDFNFDAEGDIIPMSASMGYSVIRKGEQKSLDELVSEADQGMYQDKKSSGKGR